MTADDSAKKKKKKQWNGNGRSEYCLFPTDREEKKKMYERKWKIILRERENELVEKRNIVM